MESRSKPLIRLRFGSKRRKMNREARRFTLAGLSPGLRREQVAIVGRSSPAPGIVSERRVEELPASGPQLGAAFL